MNNLSVFRPQFSVAKSNSSKSYSQLPSHSQTHILWQAYKGLQNWLDSLVCKLQIILMSQNVENIY